MYKQPTPDQRFQLTRLQKIVYLARIISKVVIV